MKWLIPVTLIMMVIIISCEKDEAPPGVMKKFSGVLLDRTTGQPIANATVKIIRLVNNAVLFSNGIDPNLVRELHSGSLRTVDSILTDGNGLYTLDPVDAGSYTHYSVAAYKTGYTHPYIIPAKLLIPPGNAFDTTFLERNSYLQLTINNELPASPTDTITVYTRYMTSDSILVSYLRPGANPPDSLTLTGAVSNFTITDTIPYKPFSRASILWSVRTDSIITKDSFIIDLIEFGVRKDTLNY